MFVQRERERERGWERGKERGSIVVVFREQQIPSGKWTDEEGFEGDYLPMETI